MSTYGGSSLRVIALHEIKLEIIVRHIFSYYKGTLVALAFNVSIVIKYFKSNRTISIVYLNKVKIWT